MSNISLILFKLQTVRWFTGAIIEKYYKIIAEAVIKCWSILQTVEPDELPDTVKMSAPHTAHCLASGQIMISYMGDENANKKGAKRIIKRDHYEAMNINPAGVPIRYIKKERVV